VTASGTAAESPVEQLARASAPVADLVAGVRSEQWEWPTPCTEWDVRSLVNHLVGGNRLFTDVMHGATLDVARTQHAGDGLGDDPEAAYRGSVSGLLEAFGQPGVLEQIFQVPMGVVPGAVLVHLRLTEALVHGWDLAMATGQPVDLPEDLAEQELAFSRSQVGTSVPRGRTFAAEQPAAKDAPAATRLAAFLGRVC
jgi:uncharacterized protein (TIGR03086 family)